MADELRIKIVEMIYKAKEGHCPSSFSIVDILDVLYDKFLKYDAKNPEWEEKDWLILSKGHGASALYVVLEKYGFITQYDLDNKSTPHGILGGHPDCTKVPGVEASTGSLGNGSPLAMGVALGLKIKNKKNKVLAVSSDGSFHEGSEWEMALVAPNLKLGNFCLIIDNNHSVDPILPMLKLREKLEAFNWEVFEVDGHNKKELLNTLNLINFESDIPHVIIANTKKGYPLERFYSPTWHHKVPNEKELEEIIKELS